MERDYQLLKDVLSVPTKTYKEDRMIEFLVEWLTKNNFSFEVDEYYNIYVTKQTDENVEYFPCVVAHTDTVHQLDVINVREEKLPNDQGELKLSLKGYNDDGKPTGIGGDDKCGVFACLELLKELPNLKSAFFVSEETGCHGSKNASKTFFDNVGYVIQFDAPGNSMVSQYCMGVQLFDSNSEFFEKCDKVLTETFNRERRYESHPYTDVYMLKMLFDFSCINFAIGYYRYHTPNEYVVVEDVYNGIKTGKELIESLGYEKYKYIPKLKHGRYSLFD
jgi:acetylornithine deacetylase/succinyl-diaminopimelate desuccinylase-like protein